MFDKSTKHNYPLIQWSYEDIPGASIGFEVSRADLGDPEFTVIGNTDQKSLMDASVKPNASYTYRVAAFQIDLPDNRSEYSNTADFVPVAIIHLEAPVIISIT